MVRPVGENGNPLYLWRGQGLVLILLEEWVVTLEEGVAVARGVDSYLLVVVCGEEDPETDS
jgi:hypothetical protein